MIVIQVVCLPQIVSGIVFHLFLGFLFQDILSYRQLEIVDFIIISGNISLGSITILLQEYFQPDHGE